MLKVVDAVKAELKMPTLQVKLTPVTSQNRIPLVQNGTVDIECGSTTHNAERARQVAFSNTIFVIGTRLMTKKDSAIKDFPDLAGKNVVTTAGTTSCAATSPSRPTPPSVWRRSTAWSPGRSSA